MLQSERLDAVSITLPTHLHKDFSIKALQAGMRVLCEKPMALTLSDCDEMIAVSKVAERTLMIGHCIRFWPEYAKTKEIIDSGQYGRVLSATFRRFSQPPVWSSDNWMMDDARSGGMVLDLHIHDTDYIHYVFGIPKAVRSSGLTDTTGIRHIQTRYDYGDDSVITAEGSWLMSKSFGFEMSFTIALEKATIVYDCTRDPAFKICPAEGDAFTPKIEAGDGYLLEIEHFAEKIQGRQLAEVISPDQSRKSIQIIQAEQQSVLENRTVELE
jgi:predicted dehydrogenase